MRWLSAKLMTERRGLDGVERIKRPAEIGVIKRTRDGRPRQQDLMRQFDNTNSRIIGSVKRFGKTPVRCFQSRCSRVSSWLGLDQWRFK